MKTNLISSIASWKSAALLGLVALIATVAFSGVLSTTQTAEAATKTLKHGDSAITVAPGDTLRIEANGTPYMAVTVGSITATNFPGTIEPCYDGATCDKNKATGDVAVDVEVASNVTNGNALLTISGAGGFTTMVKVVTVSIGSNATKVTLKTDTSALLYSSTTSATLTAKVTAGTTAIEGVAVTFSTDHGTLSGTSGTTDAGGETSVTLSGPALPGVATVTVKVGALSATAKVTFYGPATAITAVPRASALGVDNESTFVLVTVTDALGNGVPGIVIKTSADSPATTDRAVTVTGPSDTAVKVGVSANVDDAVPAEDATATPAVYPTAAKSIPGCNLGTSTSDGSTQLFANPGTDDMGRCVLEVTTTQSTPAAATDTTRGTHTITVPLTATVKATATINVGGAAASITSDAPTSVDALSETAIKVTVWDDEDVPVGQITWTARIVAGDGILQYKEGAATKEDTKATGTTSDGTGTFTYIAALEGTTIIRVSAGAAVKAITIHVGEPPAPATWSADLVSGWNAVTWMGEDGASLADNTEGVNSVYQWNPANQSWDAWFPGTDGVPGANDISSLENGAVYWVNSQ